MYCWHRRRQWQTLFMACKVASPSRGRRAELGPSKKYSFARCVWPPSDGHSSAPRATGTRPEPPSPQAVHIDAADPRGKRGTTDRRVTGALGPTPCVHAMIGADNTHPSQLRVCPACPAISNAPLLYRVN
ncbi:hypothetical protein K491DRAFT_383470 [Lophiostoma macrostomum CBS 122681]|uniref:Uncharacterized protein n=1 Tax=Lophiostoma macrostomum CBS 122681 TaxID=1314788 RepID=A0A6A6TRY3_9PLEO|nr:hypothetical protein K491DRAFT_383470 [Lophiostoma macrostomum CBS 122681]